MHNNVYLESFRDIEINYHVALKLRRSVIRTAADRTNAQAYHDLMLLEPIMTDP
jgi:hypothetical protein